MTVECWRCRVIAVAVQGASDVRVLHSHNVVHVVDYRRSGQLLPSRRHLEDIVNRFGVVIRPAAWYPRVGAYCLGTVTAADISVCKRLQ